MRHVHDDFAVGGHDGTRKYLKPQVLRYLHKSYCLEAGFECWDQSFEAGWLAPGEHVGIISSSTRTLIAFVLSTGLILYWRVRIEV